MWSVRYIYIDVSEEPCVFIYLNMETVDSSEAWRAFVNTIMNLGFRKVGKCYD
jgi:hypothetical protein